MPRVLHDLVSGPELWRGAAIALVAFDAGGLARRPRAGLAIAASIAVAAATLDLVSWPAAVVLVAVGLLPARSEAPRGAPALSALAALGVYACVPDTERALVVLGAVVSGGAVAALLAWPWTGAAMSVTVAIGWVGVVDGRSRDSAVVGALAIAVLHLLLQRRAASLRSRSAWLLLLAVAAAGTGVAARVAGRGGGLARPLVLALAVVMACVVAARRIGRRSVRA